MQKLLLMSEFDLNPKFKLEKAPKNRYDLYKYLGSKDIIVPDFTNSINEVIEWSKNGLTIVVKQKNVSRLLENFSEVEKYQSNFWTKYIPKKDEYRIYVLLNEVIRCESHELQKELKNHIKPQKIRNRYNGYVYTNKDQKLVPYEVVQQALNTVKTLGLDFGIVDVLWNVYKKKATVFDVQYQLPLVQVTDERGRSTTTFSGASKNTAKFLKDMEVYEHLWHEQNKPQKVNPNINWEPAQPVAHYIEDDLAEGPDEI